MSMSLSRLEDLTESSDSPHRYAIKPTHTAAGVHLVLRRKPGTQPVQFLLPLSAKCAAFPSRSCFLNVDFSEFNQTDRQNRETENSEKPGQLEQI